MITLHPCKFKKNHPSKINTQHVTSDTATLPSHNEVLSTTNEYSCEKSKTEKSKTEKSKTEKSKTEKTQTEKSQTAKSQTEKSQTEKSQTEKS